MDGVSGITLSLYVVALYVTSPVTVACVRACVRACVCVCVCASALGFCFAKRFAH